MGQYPVEACQKVSWSLGVPWVDRDEFGVEVNLGIDKTASETLCATEATELGARASLANLVQGFCADRKKCKPAGKASVEEIIPFGDRVKNFLLLVANSSSDVLDNYFKATGKPFFSGPKY